jgi:WD40 repeat protein
MQHGKGALSSAVLADHGADVVAIVRGQLRLLQIRTDSDNYPYLNHFESEIPSRAILTALSPCGCWGVGIYSKARPSLFNIEKGRAAATIDHPYRITEFGMPFPKIIFAPTGRRFAVCDGKDVTVFETQPEEDEDQAEDDFPSPHQSGTTLEAPKPRSVLHSMFQLDRPDQPKQPERWLPQLAFTPDSRGMLIRRPRNRIQLWDVSSNAQLGEWSWRLDSLTCLTVAPDGLTAVAGARFGRVVVWDLE